MECIFCVNRICITAEIMINAMSALATGLSAVVAVWALLHTANSFRKSAKNIHYTELDNMYLELLKMALDKPYLRQPGLIQTSPLRTEQAREYAIYARMIWNFLESIADRCDEDAALRDTWYPVIQDEAGIHMAWFKSEPGGFSKEFVKQFDQNGVFGQVFMAEQI